MGSGELQRKGTLLASRGLGFLETDDIGCLGKRGNVPYGSAIPSILLRFSDVVGEGVDVVKNDPRVRNIVVESASSSVDAVKTHLLIVSVGGGSSGLSSVIVISPSSRLMYSTMVGVVSVEVPPSLGGAVKVTFRIFLLAW